MHAEFMRCPGKDPIRVIFFCPRSLSGARVHLSFVKNWLRFQPAPCEVSHAVARFTALETSAMNCKVLFLENVPRWCIEPPCKKKRTNFINNEACKTNWSETRQNDNTKGVRERDKRNTSQDEDTIRTAGVIYLSSNLTEHLERCSRSPLISPTVWTGNNLSMKPSLVPDATHTLWPHELSRRSSLTTSSAW